MQGLSARLADHVSLTTYDHLPPAAILATKRALLDALGVSLAATRHGEGCGVFLDLTEAEGGAPLATILGRRTRVPPAQAAFANGSLAHAMDFEDTHDRTALHPNSANVPAALAVAEARDCGGRELIVALALGCDLVCRLGLGLTEDPSARGWYTPAILSAFGAAAAAGSLLRLDRRGVLDALSLTLCQATCSAEIKRSPDSLIRSVREAFSARAGVQAALLAERGITGFDLPVEGQAGIYGLYGSGKINPAMLDGLGDTFEGVNLSFKPWPTCRGTHVYIDMLLRLMRQHGASAGDIERIDIDINSLNVMLCEPHEQKRTPRTSIDAKFSLPFTLALAALRGALTLPDFTPDALQSRDILALAARVEHRLEPAWPYHDATHGRLVLHLRDGRVFAMEETVAPGNPARPLPDAELYDKFRACAAQSSRPLAREAADRVIAMVADLENVCVRDLMQAVNAS